jgi:proline racemase
VSFDNVPSFVLHTQRSIEVTGLGAIAVDVAYGGMMYVIVSAVELGYGVQCSIVAATRVGENPAVVTNIEGRAWLTGISHYGTDPEDPFPEGYRLNDTWFLL